MSDYPDFMDSIAPVPLPEASAGYYEPFFLNTSVSIGAGASYTYTYNIPSADYIYAVDSISVSASAFIYMRVAAFLNDEVFMWQQAKGAVSHIFTDNPSLVFIYGDKLQINITNLDSSAHTFYISVVGTRFVRPVGYNKPPIARFTFTPEWISPGETVYFTDQSKYSPTSWDWDFDDGSPHSSQQHPTHIYENEGIYYPKLTAYNQYGYDVYQSPTPINVSQYVNFLDGTWVEVDNANIITRSQNRVTSSGSNSTVGNYVYKDYGADNINGIDIKFVACPGNTYTDMAAVMVTYGSPGCYRTNGSYRVYCNFYSGNVYLSYRETNYTICGGSVPWHGATPYYLRLVRSPNSSTFYLYKYSDSSYTTVVASTSIDCVPSSVKFRYLVVACDSCFADRDCNLYVENVYPVFSS